LSEPLSVAVVVATLRRPRALMRCLEGLREQTVEPAEVLVAVRSEDADTRAALDGVDWPALRVVTPSRPGAVAARNAAIAAARADVIAFTDDDAVPRRDWIERLLERYVDASVGAVGGRDFVYHDGELEDGRQPVVGRVLPYGRFVGFHHLGFGEARPVDFLKGANMSVRASALEGEGFDTDLRGQGAEHHEDWALSLRVKRAGWKVIYDPAVNVDHYEASRASGAPRVDPAGRDLTDRVHNQTYVAVRYLPWPRAVVHIAFVLAVGTTVGPGVLQALKRIAQTGEIRATGELFFANVRGRIAGAATGLMARRSEQCARQARRRGVRT